VYKKTINKVEHYLYDSITEYKLYHKKEPTYWKEGKEGDWVVSDDDKVCQILKKGEMNGKPYIRCLLGTHLLSSEMAGEPPKNLYTLGGDKYSNDGRMQREKATAQEWIFAKYVASGIDPLEAYKKAFSSKSESYAKLWSKKLLTTKRIKSIVSKEMKDIMNNLGINEDYLLQSAKHVIDNTDKDADRVRAIRMLMEIRDMFPKQNSQTESLTVFQGFSREQLSALKDSKQIGEIKAEKER
jgi:hypothetical protein